MPRVSVSLRLDEERMAELLQGAAALQQHKERSGLLGTLLGCYGGERVLRSQAMQRARPHYVGG